jgi:hypothetical protein
MGAITRRHVTLLARVSDPGHRRCVEAPIAQDSDLFQKASTLLLLSDRKRASSVLESARMHSLEAEPQDLSAALVNFYFMVKERSLV